MPRYEDLLAELIGTEIKCKFISDDSQSSESGKLKLLVLDNKTGVHVCKTITCVDIAGWKQLHTVLAEIRFMLAIQKHIQQQKHFMRLL